VSCDIAEPIPSTLRASTIDDPLYGYDKFTEKEVDAFAPNAVTVMAVDNLPGELPRNASEAFGEAFVQKVFPSIIDGDHDGIIERATIVKEGKLAPLFSYLEDFAAGKE
jgi:alanine dehydrogenase